MTEHRVPLMQLAATAHSEQAVAALANFAVSLVAAVLETHSDPMEVRLGLKMLVLLAVVGRSVMSC